MSKKIKQIFVDGETYDIGGDALPEGGNAGDVLTKTDSGAEWATAKSGGLHIVGPYYADGSGINYTEVFNAIKEYGPENIVLKINCTSPGRSGDDALVFNLTYNGEYGYDRHDTGGEGVYQYRGILKNTHLGRNVTMNVKIGTLDEHAVDLSYCGYELFVDSSVYDCIVDASGMGDYLTVGDAVEAGNDYIFVRNGTYNETKAWNVYSLNKSSLRVEGESRQGVVINVAESAYTNNRFIDLTYTNVDFHLSEMTFNVNLTSTSQYFAYSNKTEKCFKINECDFNLTYSGTSNKECIFRSTGMNDSTASSMATSLGYYNCNFNITTTSTGSLGLFYRGCLCHYCKINITSGSKYYIGYGNYEYKYNNSQISGGTITGSGEIYLTNSIVNSPFEGDGNDNLGFVAVGSDIQLSSVTGDSLINFYGAQSGIKAPGVTVLCTNTTQDTEGTGAQGCRIECGTFRGGAEGCYIRCTTLKVERYGFAGNTVYTNNISNTRIMIGNYIQVLSGTSITITGGQGTIMLGNYFYNPISLKMGYDYMSFIGNTVKGTASGTLDMTASKTYWNISGNTMKGITVTGTTSGSTDVYTNNII